MSVVSWLNLTLSGLTASSVSLAASASHCADMAASAPARSANSDFVCVDTALESALGDGVPTQQQEELAY